MAEKYKNEGMKNQFEELAEKDYMAAYHVEVPKEWRTTKGNVRASREEVEKFKKEFTEWKIQNKIDPKTPVYSIVGGFESLREALKARGWAENPDKESLFFDFKHSLRSKFITWNALLNQQSINYFKKKGAFNSKIGLCLTLRNLIGHNGVDPNMFFPREFDLNDANDFSNFVCNFRASKVNSN